MIAELRRFRLGGTASDVLLVALLLAIAEAESVSNTHDVPRALVMLGSGLAVLPLLARRRAPIVAGTISLGIALATVALVIDEDGGQLSMVLTVLAASYSVGAHAERGSVAWVAAAVFTMLVGMAIAEPSDLIFPALFFAFLPWLGGRLLRSHRALTRELARETVRAEEARADDRDRAIARERARIARELHDVLAHNLSAIVVQAGAARRVLERDPDAAGQAARLIADTGREALAELRYLSGAVHRDDSDPLDGPPTLRRIGDLVRSAREAGLDATLTVEGEPVDMAGRAGARGVPRRAGGAHERVEARRAGPRRGDRPLRALGGRPGDHRRRCGGHRARARRRRRRPRHRGHARARRPLRRQRRGGPRARRRVRRARPAPRHGSSGGLMPIKVLLVDDQQLIRAGFRMILGAEPDIEVVGECANGVQAVDSAARLEPDVVLMDIRMPEMDGIEATRRIVREGDGRPVRVLMLTTFDLDEYVYDALRAGASGFLLKDVPADQLADGIRLVAQGEALLAPSATRRLIVEFARTSPARREPPPAMAELTPRELEVFRLIARGRSNAEIAGELFVGETTVKTHVTRILMKLGIRDRVQAVVLAYESGIVAPGDA